MECDKWNVGNEMWKMKCGKWDVEWNVEWHAKNEM